MIFVDLLQKLMIFDPRERISAAQALVHPFFNMRLPEPELTESVEFTSMKPKLMSTEQLQGVSPPGSPIVHGAEEEKIAGKEQHMTPSARSSQFSLTHVNTLV